MASHTYVMASAAAELAALYITARELIPLRNALKEMGWPQPKTPIQTDNSTATGFVNDTIIQRRIKMIWMRLHWLRCGRPKGNSAFIGIADQPTWQITVRSTTHLHITWRTAPHMQGRSPCSCKGV
eukprot:CCRYP_015695-RA/>CCRYP_015695-RA protein AED:0.50 eAED:0.44 QI:0/0/0/1/0/0/2/0/125